GGVEGGGGCKGKVGIRTVVPLTFGGPRLFPPPPVGSSAEEVQSLLPEAKVVAAFHHIAAHELSDAGHDIECDLLICGGGAAAKETGGELGRSVGLRGGGGGAPAHNGAAGGLTPPPREDHRRHEPETSGIKVTGL